MEELCLSEESMYSPDSRSLNRLWNEIKSIFKQASAKLPCKKDNLFLEQLPESIVYFKKKMRQLSKILLQLILKKLPAYANDYKRYDYINSKLAIITDLSYRLNIDKPNILALSILEFKQFVKDLFNIVTIRFKKDDKNYKTERIKFFVDKRYQKLADHKRRVINSVLNHQKKTYYFR
ncbi:hypothetical protein RclHR1_03980020 [Rhizophagus clarus]|uniref:Uncharacterized protein n=1 Tax=Rhizophagus clarus TaxID=94130 RepID=A0A2Z6RFE0_9GLOM|nr:hypothetical protein RclHR1_03980020 [Rhizophagus clarus]